MKTFLQSTILGSTPAEKNPLKCANDHQWYHVTDYRHLLSVDPAITLKSLKCVTCVPTWETIQLDFKPMGDYESNMVLVEGWDLFDICEWFVFAYDSLVMSNY